MVKNKLRRIKTKGDIELDSNKLVMTNDWKNNHQRNVLSLTIQIEEENEESY